MMWLNSWCRALTAKAKLQGARNVRRRVARNARATGFRPRLEGLEDRCLLSGGVLDPSFGSGGLVTTAIGAYARPFAVATYANEGTANDGKIVAVGWTTGSKSGSEKMAVLRYTLDGSLDATFGATGEVLTIQGVAKAVQVQPDGKIVVAGISGGHFAVVRYNPGGTLDSSFGSKGEVITTISKNSTEKVETMALQADGKIVVAGETNPQRTTFEDLALVRYNANGTLDTTFGTGGKVTTRFSAPLRLGFLQMAIDPNTSPLDPNSGKIILGASTQVVGAEVVRYNTNGNLDIGFGTNQGFITLGNLYNPAVAVQADDCVVVACATPTALCNISLQRLNADGSLDTSFGSGGAVVTSSDPNSDYERSVMIQADGKIVVAGDQTNAQSGDNCFLVARYNTNGSPDTTFGVNGIATGAVPAGITNGDGHVAGAALEPDGRIVLAGPRVGQFPTAFSLARFLATGPQIGSFTASSSPASAGSNLTLTASNISDANPNSTTTQVAFYVQVNGTNTLFGSGTQTSPGVWTFTFTVNLAPGTYTLFAQAEDSYGVFGDPFAITLQVQ